MTLKSMTGFARSDGTGDGARWHWEVRSVNGRGLDIRLRVPSGYDGIEPKVRDAVAKRVTRGNVSLTLTLQREVEGAELKVNEAALASVLAAIARVEAAGAFERPRPEGILALRGVLDVAEASETEADIAARSSAMLADLDKALDALVAARREEGARLAGLLADQVARVEALVAAVEANPARKEEAIRARLAEQVRRLLDAASNLDEGRLHQEAALLATRSDIAEELARLTAHVAAARSLFASGEPVGRKLDFLAQEFNREANTLCSKAVDVEITRSGLELKAVIDQFREQVQNIE
ncbi:MAG: YicC/YloC family endoribonuclease [Hyphomicrobiaceae bacterium]